MAHNPEANHRVATALRKQVLRVGQPIKALADSLGVSDKTFYDWTTNRSALPAYQVGPLMAAINDAAAITETLGGEFYGFKVEKTKNLEITNGSISLDALRVQVAAGEIAAAVAAADKSSLELEKLERAISELSNVLPKILKKARGR